MSGLKTGNYFVQVPLDPYFATYYSENITLGSEGGGDNLARIDSTAHTNNVMDEDAGWRRLRITS